MRVLSTVLTLFLATASSGVFAEDYTSTTPELLQEAAIDAVDRGDGDELLSIMTEMQRREMFFFRVQPDASCKREPLKAGLIGKWPNYGTARSGYGIYLRRLALKNQTCTCLTGQATFDQFLTDEFQTIAVEVTVSDIERLSKFVTDDHGTSTENYRAFYAANCQANQ